MVVRNGSKNNDTLVGTGSADTLRGLGGDDRLQGDGGNDLLFGGLGSDSLNGGLGRDALDGGLGFDTASYSDSRKGLTIDLDDASLNTGEAIGDTYVSIEDVIGSRFGDRIFGNEESNALVGLSGNDFLFGRDGEDFLAGGRGRDVLNGGGGNDTLFFSYLPGDIDASERVVVSLDGSFANEGTAAGDRFVSIENVRGSSKNDKIAGNSDANRIVGGAGKDSLFGRAGEDLLRGDGGNDRLDGEGENDTLSGGKGNDRIYGRSGDDLLNGNSGNDSIDGGEGNDTANGGSGTDAVLGGAGDDSLSGGSGDDRVTGGLGLNTLNGDAGNDVLDASDGINAMFGGDGTDRVTYSSLNTSVGGRGVNVYLTDDSENSAGAEGDTLLDIENVSGSKFNDELVGDSKRNVLEGRDGDDGLYGQEGNDELRGQAGEDTLSGGDGLDKLFGGEGNDLLEGGAGADRFDGGAGVDTARYFDFVTGITVSLDASLAGTGIAVGDMFAGVENVIGGSKNDKIAGNSGKNRIQGEDGDDELFGRGGDDVLVGGSSSFSSTGETNTLRGEAGNDRLDASFGINKMFGGSGTDTADYRDVGNDSGIIVSLDNGATDFSSDATGDTFNSVERVIGSQFRDILYGDSRSNRLEGRDGNDLISGLGIKSFVNDTFNYDDGATNVLLGGNGEDTLFAGSDMRGGAGNDRFIVTNHVGGFKITDFELGDKLDLNWDEFRMNELDFAVSPGKFFEIHNSNTAQSLGGPMLFYNQTADTLWYDQDGVGSTFAARKIMSMNDYNLQATDFFIDL